MARRGPPSAQEYWDRKGAILTALKNMIPRKDGIIISRKVSLDEIQALLTE